MAQRQLTLPSPLVKKSNALARARWSAESVYEPRLVALVASRVRSDDADFLDYEIPLPELIHESDSGGRTYRLIADAVDNLMGRVLTVPTPTGWKKYNVFSCCEYDGKKGCIKARFDPGMREHYIGLQKHFTQYHLLEYLTLPSVYSQKIFEFLKSWDDCAETIVQLKDLHDLLNVPESFKTKYINFKARVLDKAHKDIHEKTSLAYEWEPIKKGKAVVAIRFVFSGGKKSVVVKEKKAASEQNTSQNNNKLFLNAVECFKSGKCDFKPKSKKCVLCRQINKPA